MRQYVVFEMRQDVTDLCTRYHLSHATWIPGRRPCDAHGVDGPLQIAIALSIAIGSLAATSCSRQVSEDPPEVDLVPHRIAPCEALCDVQLGECGPLPNEFIKDLDDCVRECATTDGDLSSGWGHQLETEQDACINEWMEHATCITDLTCEDQQIYWSPAESGPPQTERPCYEQWSRMTMCVYAHPYCEDDC